MKAINRRKTGIDNVVLKNRVKELRFSDENKHVRERWIIGHDFCALELLYLSHRVQGLSALHWRDKFDVNLGREIARGRAYMRLAVQVEKGQLNNCKETRLQEIPSYVEVMKMENVPIIAG